MALLKSLSCYMCSSDATSREHAPPRCLFPVTRDSADGLNYRKNLITVPACDVHNSEKSCDDEYLLFVLTGTYTSSNVGLNQFLTKVGRAFDRSPSKASRFVQRSIPVQLKREDQAEWEQGAQVIIDGARIDEALGNCARALYHYHTGSKFRGPLEVLTNFTLYLDEEFQALVDSDFNQTIKELAGEPLHGDNPAVFSYKFKDTEAMGVFYFCFYESSPAIVRFRKIVIAT